MFTGEKKFEGKIIYQISIIEICLNLNFDEERINFYAIRLSCQISYQMSSVMYDCDVAYISNASFNVNITVNYNESHA